MTTVRVYNTTPTRLMLDRAGHGIDPATWRDANPADPVTARLIDTGRIITGPADAPAPDPAPAPAGKAGSKKETV